MTAAPLSWIEREKLFAHGFHTCVGVWLEVVMASHVTPSRSGSSSSEESDEDTEVTFRVAHGGSEQNGFAEQGSLLESLPLLNLDGQGGSVGQGDASRASAERMDPRGGSLSTSEWMDSQGGSQQTGSGAQGLAASLEAADSFRSLDGGEGAE